MGSCGGGDGGDREIQVRIVKEDMVTPVARSSRRRSAAVAEKEKPKTKTKTKTKRNGAEGEQQEEIEDMADAVAAAIMGEEEREQQEDEEEEEEEERMFLSSSDIFCRNNPHNRRILFYEAPAPGVGNGGCDGEYAEMVARLKRLLRVALDAFYPLAGRLHVTGSDRLHVLCNDKGAPFVEAVVEGGVRLADLRDGGFQTLPFFHCLSPWIDSTQYLTAPPLCIQVSRFDCGGIALGIAHSHIICDGTSLWHFMSSWAECARGEAISIPPVHTRSLLKIENPSPEKARLHLEYVDDDNVKTIDQTVSVKINTFCFTKDMITRLKNKVGGQNTSYEIICAHIWRHTTKAREHSHGKKVSFVSIVNMRERAEPPLGKAYFGNAFMWTIATATSVELEEEDLASTAERIHRSLISCTNETYQNWLHWLELYDRDAMFKCCSLNNARTRASSSHNFPVFKVDFGWGKPLAARLPSAGDLGKIIFFPGKDIPGNIDAVLALPTHVMNRLESDKAFTNP